MGASRRRRIDTPDNASDHASHIMRAVDPCPRKEGADAIE
jgi:hypothetical protein